MRPEESWSRPEAAGPERAGPDLPGAGDVVLTETPTYEGALLAFRWAGADVVGIPVDHRGRARRSARGRPRPLPAKLMYLIPTFQNPTGAVARRRATAAAPNTVPAIVPVVESDLYGDSTCETAARAAPRPRPDRSRHLPGRRLQLAVPGLGSDGWWPRRRHGRPDRREDLRGSPRRRPHQRLAAAFIGSRRPRQRLGNHSPAGSVETPWSPRSPPLSPAPIPRPRRELHVWAGLPPPLGASTLVQAARERRASR